MSEREFPASPRKFSRSKIVKVGAGLLFGGGVLLAYRSFSQYGLADKESSPDKASAREIYTFFDSLFNRLDGQQGVLSDSDESSDWRVIPFGGSSIAMFRYKNPQDKMVLLIKDAGENDVINWDISMQKVEKTVAKILEGDSRYPILTDAKRGTLDPDGRENFYQFLRNLSQLLPIKDTPVVPQNPSPQLFPHDQTRA